MGRKQTAADILDSESPSIEPGTEQRYARVIGPRGNHQHEVEFTDGTRTLVTLQPRFRHLVWVKRGMFKISIYIMNHSNSICSHIYLLVKATM